MSTCFLYAPPEIYLYGMILLSTIHLLDAPYPQPDSYTEIKETHRLLGGETANAAILLAHWGARVKMDGPFLGAQTREPVLQLCERQRVDCSGFGYDPTFPGVQDLVLVGQETRTIFGWFNRFFTQERRWSAPDLAAIEAARIVSLDPFFQAESELVAVTCVNLNIPYVTIDCPFDSQIHQKSAANVLSNEFLQQTYPEQNLETVFQQYTANASGLVIFTFGDREIWYGRRDLTIQRLAPFRVSVVSTLGAGDTFRAGVVYGLMNGWEDGKIVKFAAATAALVCTRFPLALNLPGLDEISALLDESKRGAREKCHY